MTEPRLGRGDPQNRPLDLPNRSSLDSQPAPPQKSAAPRHEAELDLAALLWRSGNGDEVAFAAFYDATASKVYGMVARVTRSPGIAAEVVQEVYLMAWQQSGRFDPGRGTVLAWLCALAHRRAVDRIRQVVRGKEREQTYERPQADTPADETWQEVEQALDAHEVPGALGALGPLQREAVSLAYCQGAPTKRWPTPWRFLRGRPRPASATNSRTCDRRWEDSHEQPPPAQHGRRQPS